MNSAVRHTEPVLLHAILFIRNEKGGRLVPNVSILFGLYSSNLKSSKNHLSPDRKGR